MSLGGIVLLHSYLALVHAGSIFNLKVLNHATRIPAFSGKSAMNLIK